MTISAVNYTGTCDSLTIQADNPVAPTQIDENPEIALPNDDSTKIEDTVEIADNPTAEDSVKAKGVLRLLQQGHFKGVADVRLRINFADEINALESDKATEVAQNGLAGLTEVINAKIDEALQADGHDEDTLAGITEAKDAFNAALTAIAEDVADSSETGDLIDRLGAEFEDLSNSLNSVFIPTEIPEETPVEGATVSEEIAAAELEEPVEPAFDARQFLDDLIATYAAELQKLESELTDISILPPLSEPKGSGSAYQKFLTMYNDMSPTGVAADRTVVDNIL